MTPTTLADVFERNVLEKLTFADDGSIILTFAGALCADSSDLLCSLAPCRCSGHTNGLEHWTLEVTAHTRTAVASTLVLAWREYTECKANPWMDYTNVTKADEGWGGIEATAAQVKTALLILNLGHSCRVYADQRSALRAAYGAPLEPAGGYIALQVDKTVSVVSPAGYMISTTIQDQEVTA